MKVKARSFTGDKVALDCEPFFGERYTVYAVFVSRRGWMLLSGRRPTRAMLSAIERCPSITFTQEDS